MTLNKSLKCAGSPYLPTVFLNCNCKLASQSELAEGSIAPCRPIRSLQLPLGRGYFPHIRKEWTSTEKWHVGRKKAWMWEQPHPKSSQLTELVKGPQSCPSLTVREQGAGEGGSWQLPRYAQSRALVVGLGSTEGPV